MHSYFPGKRERINALRSAVGILLLFASLCAWPQESSAPQNPTLIPGAGGTKIATYEYGSPAGPEIFLVHGFSQSHLSWAKQYKSPTLQKFRIVVIDLRGHGASEKPTSAENYNNSDVWADDIKAVIQAKHLKKPVIVGWSYGGFIIGDFVRKYGDANLGGIVFVGAGTQLGTEDAKSLSGPGMKPLMGMLDPRQEINIPSTAEFIKTSTATPLPADEFLEAFAYNMAVAPETRLALVSRKVDSNDALAKIKAPMLIVHGEKDTILLLTASDYIADKVKHARKSYYPHAGHNPFMEDPDRFNRELADMAASK